MKIGIVDSIKILTLSVALALCSGFQAANAEDTGGYTASIVPENMTVQEKKKRFMALVAPAVKNVFAELTTQYQEADRLVTEGSGDATLKQLRLEYAVPSNEELLLALKPHPRSIAMAQAAMESGWGTSRFFVQANNIFGVWSFNENEPRIAAGEKRGDKTIWVKKYVSIEDSVRDYYRVLAKGRAFVEFRLLKMETGDPYALVKKLDRYSEKGAAYGEELASMIRYNKFYEYDK